MQASPSPKASRAHLRVSVSCGHHGGKGAPRGSEFAGVRGGRKGESENPEGSSFPTINMGIRTEKFFAALAPGAVPAERGESKGTP